MRLGGGKMPAVQLAARKRRKGRLNNGSLLVSAVEPPVLGLKVGER